MQWGFSGHRTDWSSGFSWCEWWSQYVWSGNITGEGYFRSQSWSCKASMWFILKFTGK